jgi:hypothetical protein
LGKAGRPAKIAPVGEGGANVDEALLHGCLDLVDQRDALGRSAARGGDLGPEFLMRFSPAESNGSGGLARAMRGSCASDLVKVKV